MLSSNKFVIFTALYVRLADPSVKAYTVRFSSSVACRALPRLGFSPCRDHFFNLQVATTNLAVFASICLFFYVVPRVFCSSMSWASTVFATTHPTHVCNQLASTPWKSMAGDSARRLIVCSVGGGYWRVTHCPCNISAQSPCQSPH